MAGTPQVNPDLNQAATTSKTLLDLLCLLYIVGLNLPVHCPHLIIKYKILEIVVSLVIYLYSEILHIEVLTYETRIY